MRGSIREKRRGVWVVRVDLPRGPSGQRRQKQFTVHGTKRQAEDLLSRVLAAEERMAPSAGRSGERRLTVADYLDRYAAGIQCQVRPTVHRYTVYCLRFWKERIGGMPLHRLTPDDIRTAMAKLPAPLTPRTKKEIYGRFRAALRQAVRDGILDTDPSAAVKPPYVPRTPLVVWTDAELGRFLGTVREATPARYILFRLAVATGMRRGELLGLKWQDIDLATGVIHVVRSLTPDPKGRPVLTEPKTPSSRRKIPLDPETLAELGAHRQRQVADRLAMGDRWQDHDAVFCNQRGGWLWPHNVSAQMIKVVKRAGIPYARFHDLRHLHASVLLRQGVHPKIVQERLGHASVSITLNTYSHLLPDAQAAAVEAMQRVFGAAEETGGNPQRIP